MALLEPGTLIGPNLVVDTLLGEGAFAEVYRVDHQFLGRQAMKLFKQVTSWERTRALLEEARLLSTLGHPNVVRLFDAGTVTTTAGMRGWFTMEYVAGGSLDGLIDAHRATVPLDIAVQVMRQVSAGLSIAHDQIPPIIHRDLTTANILVGYDGAGMRIRISDFGLARRADPMTLLASAQGTYAFLAPEVAGGGGYSCAGDVFALGVIGFLLLTNHLPYDDGGPINAIARFRRPPLSPSRYNSEVGPDLDGLVLSMLDTDARARPRSAVELVRAFAALRGLADSPDAIGPAEAGAVGAEAEGQRLAARALLMARRYADLSVAADLLERAVNQSPQVRREHLPRLMAWRRGVMM